MPRGQWNERLSPDINIHLRPSRMLPRADPNQSSRGSSRDIVSQPRGSSQSVSFFSRLDSLKQKTGTRHAAITIARQKIEMLSAFMLPGFPITSYTCTASSSLSQNFSRLSKSTCVFEHRSHREERKETRCGGRERHKISRMRSGFYAHHPWRKNVIGRPFHTDQ